MEKSFENLFRKSAFASYQKGQIIQVQKGQKKTQNYDFGMKYTIHPKSETMTTIDVKNFDDPKFRKPIYESGWKRVTTLRRWQELFESGVNSKKNHIGQAATSFNLSKVQALPPNLFQEKPNTTHYTSQSTASQKDKPDHRPPQKPLDLLTKQEWKEWIQYARSKSEEFAALVKSRKMNEIAWKTYLGIDSLPVYPAPTHPLSYLPALNTHTSDKRVHQPVTGRIWGVLDPSTYLVAISGFVGLLPLNEIPSNLKYSHLKRDIEVVFKKGLLDQTIEYEFHVVEAYHDRDGSPILVVSLREYDEAIRDKVNLLDGRGDLYALRQSISAAKKTNLYAPRQPTRATRNSDLHTPPSAMKNSDVNVVRQSISGSKNRNPYGMGSSHNESNLQSVDVLEGLIADMLKKRK